MSQSNPKGTNMVGFALKRRFIQVTGPDALRFLQGMWTCDFKRRTSSESCGWGLFLDSKARPVCEGVFLSLSPNDFLISVPDLQAQSAHDALEKFQIADNFELKLLDKNPYNILALWGSDTGIVASELAVPQVSGDAQDKVFSPVIGSSSFKIPRGVLGPNHYELWYQDDSQKPAFESVNQDTYDLARIQFGLPEMGKDYDSTSLVLEMPFFEAISFFKGCYIGQEVVARGTYRGKVNRYLCSFESQSELQADFIYSANDLAQPVGKLTTVVGTKGLGLLRLKNLGDSLVQKVGTEFLPIKLERCFDSGR
jgi:folate-binding protein YgfZ